MLHNCHIHLLTNRTAPNGMFPLGLMRVARTPFFGAALGWIVRRVPIIRGWPAAQRLGAFIRIGSLPSQREVFDFVRKYYPRNTRFVALPMDLEYMGAGVAPQSFREQLDELAALKSDPDYRDVLIPFVAADARREDVFEVVRTCVEDHGFGGIKLYPPLGYFPFDPGLDDVYRYAEDHQVPVLAHCSRGGVYYLGKITEAMRRHPITGERLPGRSNQAFTDNYTHPANYRYVLDRFPALRLCLAHYGGDVEWEKYLSDPWPDDDTDESWLSVISDLIRAYPNVYTDVSYVAHARRFWPLIKILMNTDGLKDKILYGSDFYMVQMEVTEREFSINVRAAVGEQEFRQMAVTNAEAFLFGHAAG